MLGRGCSILANRLRSENGQMLAMVALVVVIILGFAAMAADFGSYGSDRRMLQNAADSAALAAARNLPDAPSAEAAALAWAQENGVDPSQIVSTTIVPQGPGQPNPLVRVEMARDHEFFFARILGIQSKEVSAKAAAVITSPGGMQNIVPLAVLESVIDAADPGDTLTLKYDASDTNGVPGVMQGNFLPIQISGPGAGNCTNNSNDKYCNDLQYGSTVTLCADGVTTCDGASETPTQPGNKVGPTREGIEYRLDGTDAACDEFDEVFTLQPDGTYTFVQQCNPYAAGSLTSDRVVIIPVIQEYYPGTSQDVTIVSFAMFFITNIPNGACTGNECEVQGIYVQIDQNVGALMGIYDPNSSIHFVRLVE